MNFVKELRLNEAGVLLYRLVLVYFFYQIARFLFWIFNQELIRVTGVSEYFSIAWYGTAFDTTAILYVNALFILLSLIPLKFNTGKKYQKFLFWVYFITNGITYAFNFGDMIYYRFSQSRLSNAVIQVAQNESNLLKITLVSLWQNPLVPALFCILMFFWIKLYLIIKIKDWQPAGRFQYFLFSAFWIMIAGILVTGGIRGDFKHSTRPLSMVDANKHVKNPIQANLVLNSVFSFFRTLGSRHFELVHYTTREFIDLQIFPFKQYHFQPKVRPNIVIIIVESLAREYSGAFNRDKNIAGYVSYTPFIDSLAQHSLVFPNSFGNGRQSIHAMSSILAGIPTLKDGFTGSPYANQKIQNIVSVCNELGYDTSFYHGAPNGSMGFQGFAGILGFQSYYGLDEYGTDKDFDGIWAVWDEPFLQYVAQNAGKKKIPFMSTVFTASSHHPFKIPEKYHGKFTKGPLQMHEPVQYTDFSIRKFFETAKKKPWFHNTVFVITGDHINQVYYKEYEKPLNRFAVPILFYSPNPAYNLKGYRKETAQQIDIYPTLAELTGFQGRLRSWGKSLLSPEKYPTVMVNSDSVTHYFTVGNYLYLFDGKNFTGIYSSTDLGLEKNLQTEGTTAEMQKGMKIVKAWYQDYMDRIINHKL